MDGKVLGEMIRLSGMTYEDVGALIDVSKQMVYFYVSGRSHMNPEQERIVLPVVVSRAAERVAWFLGTVKEQWLSELAGSETTGMFNG